jgi:hypothetical protein
MAEKRIAAYREGGGLVTLIDLDKETLSHLLTRLAIHNKG